MRQLASLVVCASVTLVVGCGDASPQDESSDSVRWKSSHGTTVYLLQPDYLWLDVGVISTDEVKHSWDSVKEIEFRFVQRRPAPGATVKARYCVPSRYICVKTIDGTEQEYECGSDWFWPKMEFKGHRFGKDYSFGDDEDTRKWVGFISTHAPHVTLAGTVTHLDISSRFPVGMNEKPSLRLREVIWPEGLDEPTVKEKPSPAIDEPTDEELPTLDSLGADEPAIRGEGPPPHANSPLELEVPTIREGPPSLNPDEPEGAEQPVFRGISPKKG